MEKYIKQLIEKNPIALALLFFIGFCLSLIILFLTIIIVNNRKIEQLNNQIIKNQQEIMMTIYGDRNHN